MRRTAGGLRCSPRSETLTGLSSADEASAVGAAADRTGPPADAAGGLQVCRTTVSDLRFVHPLSIEGEDSAGTRAAAFSAQRLFRCSTCHWRGWLLPMHINDAGAVEPAAIPDLAALDVAAAGSAPTLRRKFLATRPAMMALTRHDAIPTSESSTRSAAWSTYYRWRRSAGERLRSAPCTRGHTGRSRRFAWCPAVAGLAVASRSNIDGTTRALKLALFAVGAAMPCSIVPVPNALVRRLARRPARS